ncbi:MAG TPA: SusC/RagA family protein [Prolixibacteraceae bacterium]|nr:SusC/RagA family protein [Marinilabiliales bacterium]HBL76137.1 SusC/RagA family protein [Prolixibacteraceae bacterium]HCU62253.1 SusC/RagA family protein [Prolixibacteraceae bacterium]
MKKKREQGELPWQALKKALRMIRWSLFFFCLGIIQVFAVDSYSQQAKFSMNFERTKLESVLNEIENQSDYYFLYNQDYVDVDQLVNIQAKDQKIEQLLSQLLESTGIDFSIQNRQIVLTSRENQNQVVSGQSKITVTGKVSDSAGQSLPGVSVVVKGVTNGTITDFEGNFSLSNVPGDATLVFSFVGMKTVEFSVSGKSVINVTMIEEVIGIEEVVAIGYGTMKKSDLTGSITSVSSDDLTAFPSAGIDQALQGRATGVQITSRNGSEPGGDIRIRIRGGTSINASSAPLYVIDGFAGGSVPPPEDIESIEILKDASATAIYGSRGANGVVLITTKSGKTGDTKIELNSSYSFDMVSKTINVLNATEFAEYINEARINTGSTAPFANPSSLGEGTNWQDVIFRTGSIQNHQVSASGGRENFRFYTSLGYYDQDGIVINSDYKRYTGLINLDFDAGKNLKIGTKMFYRRTLQNGIKSQEQYNVISGALTITPTIGIYNADGSYTVSPYGDPYDNPYANAMENVSESVDDMFQGTGYVDLTLLDGLVLKSTLDVRTGNSRDGSYVPKTLVDGKSVGGNAAIGATKSTLISNENYLSYNKTFNEIHKLTLLAGCSYTSNRGEYWTTRTQNFITDSFLFWNLDGGSSPQIGYSDLTEWKLASYFGRANYNLKNRYLFTFTGRYDGSSRFGENNKWGFFPSGAFAWNIMQEPFMQSLTDISQLKFRASYGVTGNTEIGIYRSLATFVATQAIINEVFVSAVIPNTVANADLSWESTKQTDIGLDIGLWNGRVSLTADYYYKKTEDLLYEVPLPEYSGYYTTLKNIGSVENKGFEFSLNTVNLKKNEFIWSTDFNLSFNRNKILVLPSGDVIEKWRPGHIVGDETNILTEGSPVGSFYGYIYDGVNKETGAPIYRDIAGRDAENNLVMEPDGVVNSSDRTIIGNPHPDFIFGLNNTLRYKNFDLNIFFQGVVGNDIMNFTRMELEWCNGKENQMATVLNRWTPTHTDTDIPKAATYSSITSSRWVEDGSYTRLKNMSLGYNVPKNISGKIGVEKLRIYVSGQNLWTITKYTGYNPDVSYNDGNTRLGLDYGSYPSTRSVTFGLNLAF